MYVSSYCYICVRIQKASAYVATCMRTNIQHYICVLILIGLYMCPHPYTSGKRALLLLSEAYMCPHTTIYVSSYCYICVLTVLNVCPHTGEASALAPHAPGHDMLYKPHTDAELSTIANQTVYMQLLSNRDLAVALRYALYYWLS